MIIGCPSISLGCITIKYIGYSHDTMDTMTSSRISTCLSLDLTASSNIIGAGRRFFNCNASKVVIVVMFIEAP